MPLHEEYLETSQVIRLTQHFLAKKAQEDRFVSYETYVQSPLEGKSFGGSSPSSVIAMAKRPAGQPPVLFACDGQPDDAKRKEAKAPWKLSEIVLKAMNEWVCSQLQQDSKETDLSHLDFDFHLSLRRSNHWTVYIFKFRGAQQAALEELAEIDEKYSKTEKPRELEDSQSACSFFEQKKVPDLKYITGLKTSAYVLVGKQLFYFDKRHNPTTDREISIRSCKIKVISSENLALIKKEFKPPISDLSRAQKERIKTLTGHSHGAGGRIIKDELTRQEQKQKGEAHAKLAQLYQSVTVSHADPKRWSIPAEIRSDLIAVFEKLSITRPLECTYQMDGYTCGDRAARNTVAAAIGDSLAEALDTYDVRLETMAILDIPLVQNAIFFTGYILLRCVAVLVVCFVLNYFLAANILAALGGLGGLLGIGLGAWALFEMARWLMQPETKAGEAAAYERFKPKATVSTSGKPTSLPSVSLLPKTAPVTLVSCSARPTVGSSPKTTIKPDA